MVRISFDDATYQPEGNYAISGSNLNFYMKCFYGKYIAPWGKYLMFGFTSIRYKTTYDPQLMKILVYDTVNSNGGGPTAKYYSNFGLLEQKYKYADVQVGFGESRMFADRIVSNFGCSFSALSFLGLIYKRLNFNTIRSSWMNTYISNTSLARVRVLTASMFFLK